MMIGDQRRNLNIAITVEEFPAYRLAGHAPPTGHEVTDIYVFSLLQKQYIPWAR